MEADLCLLRLPSQFRTLEDCRLDTTFDVSDDLFHDGSEWDATLIGWNTQARNELQYASIPLVPRSECEHLWGFAQPCHVCAGNASVDACFGDSGGPLYFDTIAVAGNITGNRQGRVGEISDDANLLIGLVSFGVNGGASCTSQVHQLYPTVFTNVACYAEWIRSYVASQSQQDLVCACTTNALSDDISVSHSGCRAETISIFLAAGDSRSYCYTKGGLQCLEAHASVNYPFAGWRWCGSTLSDRYNADDEVDAKEPQPTPALIVAITISTCFIAVTTIRVFQDCKK